MSVVVAKCRPVKVVAEKGNRNTITEYQQEGMKISNSEAIAYPKEILEISFYITSA